MKVPEGWIVGHVKDLLAALNSGVSVNGEDRSANIIEIGVLKVSSVSSGVFLPNENKRVIQSEVNLIKESPHKGSILISRSNTEALVGASVFIDKDYPNLFLSDKLWQTVPKKGNTTDQKWLFYFLASEPTRYRLSKLATGTSGSMKNITKDELLSLPIKIPPHLEQQKIAQILSTWDKAIATQGALIVAKQMQKKALMQQLLTGKKRFAGFQDEWVETELGELFNEVKEKVGDKRLKPHSITSGTGFVSHQKKWGKDISGSQYSNYTLLKKGQFSYNKGNSKKYPCGCMYLLKHADEIAVPNVFISFERLNNNVCNEFYEQYFMADYCARELKKYITSGARSDGLLNLSKKDFFSINLPLPSVNEQQKIAAVLATADKGIQTQQKQLVVLKQQKKGLMQQLLTGAKRVQVDV